MTNLFLDPILARWKSDPDRLFAQFYTDGDWSSISYDQLMQRAIQFARLICNAGSGQGDIVCVILEYGLDAHAAFLGGMLAGAAPSFLPHPNIKQDPALYWKQHREIFTLIGAKAIVVYDELKEPVAQALGDRKVAVIAASQTAANAEPWTLPPPTSEAVALVQHSSGTTGLKKGTALTYAAICGQIESYARAIALADVADPVVATWLPLYHDMGLISSFLMPLWLGIPIVGIDPFKWVARPPLLFEAVQKFRATHLWSPNFSFHHLVRTAPKGARYDLSSIRMIVNCSESCKPAAFDRFLERFSSAGVTAQTLQTCYAMAETVFAVSQSAPDRPVRRLEIDSSCITALESVRPPRQKADAVTLLSNGRPIRGCEVSILRDGTFVGEGEIGEICVRASFLFAGYYKNEQATRDAFVADWYRTGDLGFLDHGEVFLVGRLKDLIIVNGKNVFAHDVEAALGGIPGLKPGRAVAFGNFVEALGSEQLVVVAERDGVVENMPEMIADINRVVLNEIGIPCGDIRIVEQGWLVKTTSGKISRSLNNTKYAQTFRDKR